jgi:hypothetical protein
VVGAFHPTEAPGEGEDFEMEEHLD